MKAGAPSFPMDRRVAAIALPGILLSLAADRASDESIGIVVVSPYGNSGVFTRYGGSS